MTKLLATLAALITALLAVPIACAALATTSNAAAEPETVTDSDCLQAAPTAGQWRAPLSTGYAITSRFGMRLHPVRRVWKLHNGVDLVAPPASPVVAAAGGIVTTASPHPAWGNHVVIQHTGGITTLYAHLATIKSGIKPGSRVAAGQVLGVQGSTGYSTGAHLHFTVTVNNTDVDPEPFMTSHGAPLDGRPTATTPARSTAGTVEGGVGFDLPQPTVRQDSLHNPALPIPADVEKLYKDAAAKYGLPWTLLAGIGMEETAHGRNTATSSAGAQGLMQFMPATFASYGVDGNGDGRAVITDRADSIHSAANYLVASGVLKGPDGIRRALFVYNHADWYVGDVLHYAHTYGGGTVTGTTTACEPGIETSIGSGTEPLPAGQTGRVLAWAKTKLGGPYVMGAAGPAAYDCSSYVQAAYRTAGITLPRTAQDQRDWLAAGHGQRIQPGQEKPGDLIFINSYLGPTRVGHVALVWNPTTKQTIEAASSSRGIIIGDYRSWTSKQIFEIWRVNG